MTKPNYINSIVRNNLLTEKGYTPYCGSWEPACDCPRTYFTGSQFKCPKCTWVSNFPIEFINEYKEKWNIK